MPVKGGRKRSFSRVGSALPALGLQSTRFSPLSCDGCLKHTQCSRSFVWNTSCKSHECPKSYHNSRKVFACETCSMSIDMIARESKKAIQQKHDESGDCDPKWKKQPTCAVRRCKEILSFSDTSTCKTCHIKVCLKHRFPANQACKHAISVSSSSARFSREATNKFLVTLA